MRRLALVFAVTWSSLGLADVAPRRPAPRATDCTADSDCVITSFAGCCETCCLRAPYAVSATKLRADQARCAAVDCPAPKCGEAVCVAVVPEPESSFRAVCEASRCVARKASEVDECRADADCKVAWSLPPAGAACYATPCGCCPTNVPMRVNAAPRPAPPSKKGEAPARSFGVSTGDGGAPGAPLPPGMAPTCAPCPQPWPSRAACVLRKCSVVEVKRKAP